MKPLEKIVFPFLLSLICACKTTIEEPKITSGNADLSKYLAVGGSFTAGYMDGALYLEGQQNSYPSILSKSFSKVSDQPFIQPLVNPGVGIGLDSNSKLVLTNSTFCYGNSLSPVYASQPGDFSDYEWIGSTGPFNNIGVPGLRIFQINNQLLGNPQAGNSYYARFVKMQDNDHTILSDITEFNPTFFTYWLGMDDLLPYALSGGTDDNDPVVDPGFPSTFDTYLELMIKTLCANNAKGAIGNIPDVLDFPYFRAIPYDGVVLTAAEAAEINAILAQSFPDLQYHEGNNPFIIDDSSAPNGKRFIASNEFVLMSVPLDSIKCFHYGSYDLQSGRLIPLPDKYVIDGAEGSLIRSRQIAFSARLMEVADEKDLAYVNIFELVRQLDVEIKLNGTTYSLEFIHGGAFSLDGIHPTAKGNALIANEFIKAINSKYGASLREVDVNEYPGVKFP
ncbi:MAG TPA: hypothetical protein VJY62_15760 [Bacteroidia bacterium]|nr:hypothetical protein [Bacteroidia bacterium]